MCPCVCLLFKFTGKSVSFKIFNEVICLTSFYLFIRIYQNSQKWTTSNVYYQSKAKICECNNLSLAETQRFPEECEISLTEKVNFLKWTTGNESKNSLTEAELPTLCSDGPGTFSMIMKIGRLDYTKKQRSLKYYWKFGERSLSPDLLYP